MLKVNKRLDRMFADKKFLVSVSLCYYRMLLQRNQSPSHLQQSLLGPDRRVEFLGTGPVQPKD